MKVAFLDRDGVINEETGYVHQKSDFRYTKYCLRGLQLIRDKGFAVAIITNQAGIAKGMYTEQQYLDLTRWYLSDLAKKSIDILSVEYCPHHQHAVILDYKKECRCRKPNTGMIDKVATKFSVNLKESILVGDKETDIMAANRAGIGKSYLIRSRETPSHLDAFDNLYDVARAL